MRFESCRSKTTRPGSAAHNCRWEAAVRPLPCDPQHYKQQQQWHHGKQPKENYSASRRYGEGWVTSLRRRISEAVCRALTQQKELLWALLGKADNYFVFKISPLSEQCQAKDWERSQQDLTAKEWASRMCEYLRLPRRPDKRPAEIVKEIDLDSQHMLAQLFILAINPAKDD